MDEFQQSHKSLMDGVRQHFEQTERKYPEPQYKGLIDTLREQVNKFCNSAVPQNFDQFVKLSQDHTMILMAIGFTNNALRRMKMAR